jgi:hypothetical protein
MMDGLQFDRFSRNFTTIVSRRGALKGVAGVMGGAILSRIGATSGLAASKVGVCHHTGSATNPVVYIRVSRKATKAHAAHGDTINPDFANDPNNCGSCGVTCGNGLTCQDGLCVATTTCTEFILSGGPSPEETIGVDDDLTVYLNGTAIFVNDDQFATELPPISFSGQNGDQLRVVATDTAFCRSIDPLYLHCASSGTVQILDVNGLDQGCDASRPVPEVFYDRTFTIDMP